MQTVVNLENEKENEKKKNIRLAVGVASIGIIGFLFIYTVFFVIMFFSPFMLFSFFPFPSFTEGVVGLDGDLLIFSKAFDFRGATYEKPPREQTTLRIYNGESLSKPEEIKPFASFYPAEDKIYFFDSGFYRTFGMKRWEEFKNSAIGSNPKGAVGAGGIWVLSTVRKQPALMLITEEGAKEVHLPDDELTEKIKVCSSQLLCLGDELHLFWKNEGSLIWYKYDGNKWSQPETFENNGGYKAIVFKGEIFLIHFMNFGNQPEITFRVYNKNSWSEPKTLDIGGTAIITMPAVFKDRLIIFQQGFFSEKYYILNTEHVEGPFTIRKPFLSIDLWKVLVITLLFQVIFFIFIFFLSLLIRKFKMKTWRVNTREYEFASLFRRSLAEAIDFLILAIPAAAPFFFVLEDDFIFGNPLKFVGLILYSVMVMVLGSFLYHSLLEGLWGKTIGKKICGIVVLKDDFTKCTVGRGFLRNVMRIVDGFFYYLVAAVAIAGTLKWQRLGDIVAGTVVVRDK